MTFGALCVTVSFMSPRAATEVLQIMSYGAQAEGSQTARNKCFGVLSN